MFCAAGQGARTACCLRDRQSWLNFWRKYGKAPRRVIGGNCQWFLPFVGSQGISLFDRFDLLVTIALRNTVLTKARWCDVWRYFLCIGSLADAS
jgi:hypothetical protein